MIADCTGSSEAALAGALAGGVEEAVTTLMSYWRKRRGDLAAAGDHGPDPPASFEDGAAVSRSHEPNPPGPRVAVIGGGLAGMAAALILAENGCPVDLFEQKLRLGGRVAFAEVYAGFGQGVVIDHGHDDFSLYGFRDTVARAAGARVRAGEPIGTVGRGPSGSGALYFELRIDGRPVDPVQWLHPRQ